MIAFVKALIRDIALASVNAPPRLTGKKVQKMVSPVTRALLERELSTPLPETDLIYTVNAHRDARNFAASRSATARNVVELLAESGIDFDAVRSILDFGCGCGRILAGWEHFARQGVQLHGFDVNSQLIDFCQKNILFAKTDISSYYPPLPLADDSVDFAYAASVWTHLGLAASQQWAGEFARVVKPGGVAMVSYHGSYFAPVLAKTSVEGTRELEERGFYMHQHRPTDMTFAGSNDYATFMTSAFVRSLFVGFEVVRIFPGVSHGPNPFASYQDIAILRRR
jgi:SAM-dependent methyltransferase